MGIEGRAAPGRDRWDDPRMDRTVLITGGTGGLGRAVVAAFAADGWRVVVPDAAPAPRSTAPRWSRPT